MLIRWLTASLLVFLALVPAALADDLPRAEPAQVGLDPATLAKIDAVAKAHIAKREIAGAVAVVARRGQVAYLKAFGAFKEDSIVRMYSMSKPVTVAAVLMLVDEGKLKLSDPVSKYIPSFGTLKVEGSEEQPAAMTVQHLMQHTAGLTYGFFGNTTVDQLYRKQNVLDKKGTLESMTAKLGGLPLLFEPGARWHYSVSIDVLGRLVEVVSKKTFDVFLKERLFTPLGMTDTGFHVPKEKAARLVSNYGARQYEFEKAATSPFLTKPGLLSGGGGLVSTARDYTTFVLMLAAGGTWKGKRYLTQASVKAMTTNQLPKALVPIRLGIAPMVGMGFGLGVSVRVSGKSAATSIGEWGWGGAASTTFFVAPKEDLVVVTLTQRMPMWNGLDRSIRPLVYAAARKKAPEPATTGK